MAYHAKLSPSSADRWTSCTASVKAQEGLTDDGSDAARLGTCQHQMDEEILRDGADPQSYLGRKMLFWNHDGSETSGEDWAEVFDNVVPDPTLDFLHEVVVTQEMIDECVTATAYVQQLVETSGGVMEVEQRVPIGHFTGEEGAGGTSDVCIMTADTIHVVDFKHGRNKVTAYDVLVPAHIDTFTKEPVAEVLRPNLQMACYALGSIEKFGLLYDFKKVTMTIVQPAIGHVSEYSCTVDELMKVQEFLRVKAEETRTNPVFVPSSDNCHFCKNAGPTCEAQTKAVFDLAVAGFDDLETATVKPVATAALGQCYALIGMVSDWCKAVASRVQDELRVGNPVVRADGLAYKLVAGRKGDRQWADEAVAEATMKKMRLKFDQMYVSKVIGPATAEKLAKAPKAKKGEIAAAPVLGATQWNRLDALITQKDGSASVVLETDPRPALPGAADGFDDVPEVPQTCEDLF
jgi:hypothetical protein